MARPLNTKESVHLVLKSSLAVGAKSMLNTKHSKKIETLLHTLSRRFGIKIYRYVNVGNHLHLVIRIGRRHSYRHFIRAATGVIARLVLERERGPGANSSLSPSRRSAPPKKLNESNLKVAERQPNNKTFWDARPFTRIIAWGKDFQNISSYMQKNANQAVRNFHSWGFEVLDLEAIRWLSSA